jgi:DNA-nicking Smr family endonuclease
LSRQRADHDARVFKGAMRDVEPLGETRRRPPVRRKRSDSGGRASPHFEHLEEGSRRYGRRADVPSVRLEELRAGLVEPANTLDLHGMSEDAARERVFRFVRQASQSGLECVAIVHGRGLRSPDGPVLKGALPEWLTQLPLARVVGAFASAPRDRGGDGVTFVLLVG